MAFSFSKKKIKKKGDKKRRKEKEKKTTHAKTLQHRATSFSLWPTAELEAIIVF